MPIGNLISQFFANVYLNGFDHFVKEQLGFSDYIRYMDDFVLFSHDKENLKIAKKIIADFLKYELKLSLKESATYINSNANGLGFLGKRIFPQVVRIKRENLKRSVKKLKRRHYEFNNNIIEEESFFHSIASISGYLSEGNSYNLRKALI